MSILIVDDSQQHLRLTEHILDKGGFTGVVSAQSAEEAFEILGLQNLGSQDPGLQDPWRRTDIHLVLMDVLMPGMDGIEAIRRIKAAEHLRNIPIVVVTAASEVDRLESAFEAGAVDFIAKPLGKVELLARVRSSLELWKARDELEQRVAKRTSELLAANTELKREVEERERFAEELRRERNFVKSLVETAQTIILVLDTYECIVWLNPYFEEIAGYKAGEVLGRDWLSTFVPEAGRGAVKEILQAALEEKSSRGYISPIVTRKGELRDIEWYDKTLKDDLGNTTGLLAVGQDVTERMRLENELRMSEAKNRAIVSAIPDLIFVLDRQGTYLDYHAKDHSALIAPPEALLGRKITEVLPADVAAACMSTMKEAIRAGELQTIEYSLALGKEIRTFEGRVVPYGDDKLLFIARDITEWKRAQKMLQLKQYSIDNSSIATIWSDPKGRLLRVNKAACALFGYNEEELLGKAIDDLDDGSPFETWVDDWQRLENGSTIRFETRAVGAKGRRIVVEVDASCLGFEGEDYCFAFVRDITRRKENEEKLKKLHEHLLREHERRKDLSRRLIELMEGEHKRVAMDLHDDIGQILTTLKMDLEWVSDHADRLDPGCRERIESARAAAAEAMKGIKALAHGLRPSLLDDLGLVRSLRNLVDDIRRSANVEIHFFTLDVPGNLSPEKATAVYRVIQEILSNAVKHARPQNIHISLIAKPDGVLSLCAEDDGIGFDLDRVRLDPQDKRPMGLLFLEERILQIGGELHMESRPGEGTHFMIDIPL